MFQTIIPESKCEEKVITISTSYNAFQIIEKNARKFLEIGKLKTKIITLKFILKNWKTTGNHMHIVWRNWFTFLSDFCELLYLKRVYSWVLVFIDLCNLLQWKMIFQDLKMICIIPKINGKVLIFWCLIQEHYCRINGAQFASFTITHTKY